MWNSTRYSYYRERCLGRCLEAVVQGMSRELAVWSESPRWAGSGFTRLGSADSCRELLDLKMCLFDNFPIHLELTINDRLELHRSGGNHRQADFGEPRTHLCFG